MDICVDICVTADFYRAACICMIKLSVCLSNAWIVTNQKETIVPTFNQSINQYIYNAPWYRGACYSAGYAEAKRNVLSRVLNVITHGAVRQFRGSEFQSLGAATEK